VTSVSEQCTDCFDFNLPKLLVSCPLKFVSSGKKAVTHNFSCCCCKIVVGQYVDSLVSRLHHEARSAYLRVCSELSLNGISLSDHLTLIKKGLFMSNQ